MLKRNPTCNGCEKCGAKLNGLTACCCTHTCAAICVKLQPESECPPQDTCECDEPQSVYVIYDPITESYHGTISCGTASVDFDIKLKHDKDLGCLMCLTSSCLDFYGANCQEAFDGTPSCIGTKDIQNGDLIGGMEFSWPITMENCGDPYCITTFELSAKCVDRISPEEITETYVDSGCTGCECLCKEFCITWMYDDGIDSCTKQARSKFDHNSNAWEFSFTATANEPAACTLDVILFLEKNEYTGACEMVIITNLANSYSEAETRVTLDECPFINIQDLIINEFETINITCYECKDCEPNPCLCDCFELPDVLNVSWSYRYPPGFPRQPCVYGPPSQPSECVPVSFQLIRGFVSLKRFSIFRCGYFALNKFCSGENVPSFYPETLSNAVIGNEFPGFSIRCKADESAQGGDPNRGHFDLISYSCNPFEVVLESRTPGLSSVCVSVCPELYVAEDIRVVITE